LFVQLDVQQEPLVHLPLPPLQEVPLGDVEV